LIDHHEYQTVNKIALRNLDTNNPFYEKYFRESMKSFSQINYRKFTPSLFDQDLFISMSRCGLRFEKPLKLKSDLF